VWLAPRFRLPVWAVVLVAGVLGGIWWHEFLVAVSEANSCAFDVDFPLTWVEGCPEPT
jgi:hypothetical protein